MFRTFIDRPVLSAVISILIVIVGSISLSNLSIALFPEIALPTVVVSANYPGANAETVARAVATPLEESINGVEDMLYMKSNSNNDGTMSLSIYFKQGTNPDIAAVNVQNRVAKVTNQLPQEVVQAGVTTQKRQNEMLRYITVYSTDSTYNNAFVENYVRINLFPVLQRIPGVAAVEPFGNMEHAMRIWLNPDRLKSYNISPQEVVALIRQQNIEAAPGRLGAQSSETFEYVLKFKGKNNLPEQFEDMIIRTDDYGGIIRLKDVARIEFGLRSYTLSGVMNGYPVTSFSVVQSKGSNGNEIMKEMDKILDDFTQNLPPGIELSMMIDSKVFLDSSINQLVRTLIEAFVLVFLIVFLFLQDIRSTLIPAIAVPVAIIGTFFFMQVFGFSINLLTMFALILAIGTVVDDAIVVVEAVREKMDNTGFKARKATHQTMREITAPIISITLVIMAVFIPVSFMGGSTGIFYRQFAFTMTFAILISGINALTLSPMLCALLLKTNTKYNEGKSQNIIRHFFTAYNSSYNAFGKKYVSAVKFTFCHKWVTIGMLAVITVSAFILLQTTQTGFIPAEDKGIINGIVSVQTASSLDNTEKIMKEIETVIKDKPYIEYVYLVSGLNGITSASTSSNGVVTIQLKPIEERGKEKNIFRIAAELNAEVNAKVKDAKVSFFTSPMVPGFGLISGFEFMLQDRGNGSPESLDVNTQEFLSALNNREEIGSAFTSFTANYPQLEIVVDEDKAAQYRVSLNDLMETLQIYFGSIFVTDINRFGKYYRVIAQSDIAFRTDASSIDNIFVKNDSGEMIPVNQFIELKRIYGAEFISRHNLFIATQINGTPATGYSSGDAIRAIEETAAKVLPRNYSYEWTGLSREESSTTSQFLLIFVMSLVFVYFILAALYESFILPLAVIATIPIGVLGVMLFINLFGIENNIYVQVAMVMLIGLLAKNAILIVEYALIRRKSGESLIDSARNAAQLRLRPILMTSFTFIFGLLPLLFTRGGSAAGNFSIGISSIGGMLVGVGLGILFVPLLFIIFQSLQEKLGKLHNDFLNEETN